MLIERSQPARPPRRMPTNPKPVLIVTLVPVFRVHYTVLEAYIKVVFGFDFDFLEAVGCVEGVSVDFKVGGDSIGPAWEQRADELRGGRRQKSLPLILNTLVRDGYIKAGLYTVTTNKLPDPTQIYTEIIRRTQDPSHPECVAFKTKHRKDKVFMGRSSILDEAVLKATTDQ